jgi:methylated-DNA-[protein]-cysteine S-methyltransferase
MKSPIGQLLLVAHEQALTHLIWSSSTDAKALKKQSLNKETPLLKETKKQLNEYFSGKRTVFNLALQPSGTDFQKKAWKALEKIPFGKTWSYKEQALRLGSENAMRAVGGANGCNPISIVVPCHRVIGANGKLTGYGGGIEKKRILLELEGHSIQNEKIQS